MVEWRSPMHTSGSHSLTATSTGHDPYLPSFSRKDWGCLVALSQSRNRKPGGTLKMSPWPWLREDRSRLTHPERCLSNCSWSVPKQSYRFPSNLKDRENWLLPWSSQQLHITPPCCGSCAKTVQKLCALLKRCILAALFEHLYLCYPAGVVYSGLHQPSGLPSYQAMSPKLQVYYLCGLKLIQTSCASVWGQNCLCSAGCKCTLQTFKALPTASSNFTLFCLCWSGWADIFFFPST